MLASAKGVIVADRNLGINYSREQRSNLLFISSSIEVNNIRIERIVNREIQLLSTLHRVQISMGHLVVGFATFFVKFVSCEFYRE
jgi:hypothetical protein